MPYRRRRRKRAKRPRKRRRRTKRRRRRTRQFRPTASKTIKMRFMEWISLSAAQDTSYINIACNDIYHPIPSATIGHQPFGYDQMALQYNHYSVIASKLTVNFTTTSGALSPVLCSISLEELNAAPTVNIFDEIEQGKVSYGIMTGRNAGGMVTLSKTFSAKKIFGTKSLVAHSDFTADTGFSPIKIWHWRIMTQNLNMDDVADLWIVVKIEYITKYTEPIELANS